MNRTSTSTTQTPTPTAKYTALEVAEELRLEEDKAKAAWTAFVGRKMRSAAIAYGCRAR